MCECDCEADDDWKTEYEQLSEDYRSYVQMGWQATFAVLFGDALVLSYFVPLHVSHAAFFDAVCVVLALITYLMAWETMKWIVRSDQRVNRLRVLEGPHDFHRFSEREAWGLDWHIGWVLLLVMWAVSFALFAMPVVNYLMPCII
jgi:hypothetical protein